MKDTPVDKIRSLSKDGSLHVTDESINTVTSIVGGCLALLGTTLLIAQSVSANKIWHIISFTIYGLAIMSLFTFSALHHGVEGSPKTNLVLRTLDYVTVFLVIAGTVTPLVMILNRTAIGWSVLGVTWTIAALGITLRSAIPNLPKHITNTFFITLGWLPAILLITGKQLPAGALSLLVVGGLFYSAGFTMFITEKPNPVPGYFGFHEIWHLCVIAGAATHFILMYMYLLPA